MATIRKRAWTTPAGLLRERWQVDFRDQTGKRRHKQFDRKKDADRYLVKARNQVDEGTFTPDSSSTTIRQAADLWLARATVEKLERTTLTDYQRSVEIICALIDPDTRLARLTTPRCEQLRDDLLQQYSRPMAQRTLKHFKGIIKDARRRGLIASNPAAETKIGGAERHKARLTAGVDFPMPDELKAILNVATGEPRALFCLAGLAGLRASELRGLRWTDIDLGQHPTVTISQRADRWCRIGSPKSTAARRTVPLGETAAQALRAWKVGQPPITYREDGERRHTLGACGAIEAWLTIEMMRDGWFPAIANLETVDPLCVGPNYLVGAGELLDVEIAVSNNFAFGGINTSLVIRRY